jgi:hypothetical protein
VSIPEEFRIDDGRGGVDTRVFDGDDPIRVEDSFGQESRVDLGVPGRQAETDITDVGRGVTPKDLGDFAIQNPFTGNRLERDLGIAANQAGQTVDAGIQTIEQFTDPGVDAVAEGVTTASQLPFGPGEGDIERAQAAAQGAQDVTLDVAERSSRLVTEDPIRVVGAGKEVAETAAFGASGVASLDPDTIAETGSAIGGQAVGLAGATARGTAREFQNEPEQLGTDLLAGLAFGRTFSRGARGVADRIRGPDIDESTTRTVARADSGVRRTDLPEERFDPFSNVDPGASLRDEFDTADSGFMPTRRLRSDDRGQLQLPRGRQRGDTDGDGIIRDDRVVGENDLGTPDPIGEEIGRRQIAEQRELQPERGSLEARARGVNPDPEPEFGQRAVPRQGSLEARAADGPSGSNVGVGGALERRRQAQRQEVRTDDAGPAGGDTVDTVEDTTGRLEDAARSQVRTDERLDTVAIETQRGETVDVSREPRAGTIERTRAEQRDGRRAEARDRLAPADEDVAQLATAAPGAADPDSDPDSAGGFSRRPPSAPSPTPDRDSRRRPRDLDIDDEEERDRPSEDPIARLYEETFRFSVATPEQVSRLL